MKDSNTFLVVDGHSLLFRAFYALDESKFSSGSQPTNAVYGFFSMLCEVVEKYRPYYVAVAFDTSGGTFRNRLLPCYKAQRPKTPESFAKQLETVKKALSLLDVKWFTKEGFEGDDIVASLSRKGEEEGCRVLIVSGDKDVFQLIDGKVSVIFPGRHFKDFSLKTPEAILEAYSIPPSLYPDLAALRGEGADNIPGVRGVGDKIAAKWLLEFGSLKKLLEEAGSIKGAKGEELRKDEEQVLLNRRVNQLVSDLSFPVPISGMHPRELSKDFDSFMQSLSFQEKTIRKIETSFGYSSPAPGEDLISLASAREGKAYFAEGLPSGFILHTLSAGVEGKWENEIPDMLRTGSGWTALDYKGAMEKAGPLPLPASDLSLASYLFDPDHPAEAMKPALEKEGKEKLGAILSLSRALEGDLEKRGEKELLHGIEIPVAKILFDMEKRGVLVDKSALEEMKGFFDSQCALSSSLAMEALGFGHAQVNLNSPKQVSSVLYGEFRLKGSGTSAAALEKIASQVDPEGPEEKFIQALLKFREEGKLSEIVSSLLKAVSPDGRIYSTFDQKSTGTGRIASQDPNLQTIPNRTEEGRQIRSAFIAPKGWKLLSCDYSQIELRIMADLSGDEKLIEAFRSGGDFHRYIAHLVYGVPEDEVTANQRTSVKQVSYGLAYGLSAFGLASRLRIPQKEARELEEKYFAIFGAVKRYLDLQVKEAARKGYSETILGRRRYFPDLSSPSPQARRASERAARNAPIQGSAADIMKLAMIKAAHSLEERGLKSRMVLQIHDELLVEVAPGEEEEAGESIRLAMEGAADLKVPLTVSMGWGDNWQQAAH
ncbi:MAG: hypothetical protein J6V96_02460 [Aeriscardovia sp.]|nr:hypothetical protein [Aeriscardovia sp.]